MLGKKHRSTLEQFQKNAAGEYVYTGGYMMFADCGKSRKRTLAELWCAAGAGSVCLVAGGVLPIPALSGCAYVVIPYLTGVLAAISVLWALGQLTAGGDPLRQYVYEATVVKIPGRAMLAAVAGACCILASGVYCIRSGGAGSRSMTLAFLLLEAAGAMAMLGARLLIKRAAWKEA